jgi:hypothetical protein
MRGTAAVLLALCGCNAIFGLDATHVGHVDAGGDDAAIDAAHADAGGCHPIGHDEDHDGTDDGCDLCPQLANAGDQPDVDSDGDGIGDPCDPDPKDGHDTLLLFDSFGVPDGWVVYRGTWNRQDDALAELDISTPSTLAMRTLPDPNATDVTVDVVFTIDAMAPAQAAELVAQRGIGVWFVASGGNAVSDPSGYRCDLLEDVAAMVPTTTAALSVYQQNIASQLGQQAYPLHVPTATVGRFRVHRGPDGVGRETCTALLGAIDAQFSSDNNALAQGSIGLRSASTAIHVLSVTAYGKMP